MDTMLVKQILRIRHDDKCEFTTVRVWIPAALGFGYHTGLIV